MKTKVINFYHQTSIDKSNTVYIGRPSKWGNPFKIGKDGTREEVIKKYEIWLLKQDNLMLDLKELKGKILTCFCVEKPIDFIRDDKRCHGEILLEFIENADKVQ